MLDIVETPQTRSRRKVEIHVLLRMGNIFGDFHHLSHNCFADKVPKELWSISIYPESMLMKYLNVQTLAQVYVKISVHRFEPYVNSILLCKTKTVNKVSITMKFIANISVP